MIEENLSAGIVALVIMAAIFHAIWNAILKKGDDKLLDIIFSEIFWLPFALVLMFFLPLPDPQSWVFIVISASIHIAYMFFLARTYTSADLSHAYVLLRGFSPFLIALGGHFFIGEDLTPKAWCGIITITSGLVFLGWPSKNEHFCLKTLGFIALTSMTIVSYTLIDGMGARLSSNSLSYLLWYALLQIPFLLAWVAWSRGRDGFAYGIRNWKRSFIILVLSYTAYGIVLWAMTKAPIGLVSALRETSVIFATLIGIFIFKEGFARKRIIAATFVCLGAILIKL